MLAQCTVRPTSSRPSIWVPVCGVQAFHLAGHARRGGRRPTSAIGACELAAFNAALNGIQLDLRRGSLFEPVADERFDLVVSNPPFVIGSPGACQARLPRRRVGR